MWSGAKMRCCRNSRKGWPETLATTKTENDVAGIAVVPLRAGREHGVIGLLEEGENFGVLNLIFRGPMMRERIVGIGRVGLVH